MPKNRIADHRSLNLIPFLTRDLKRVRKMNVLKSNFWAECALGKLIVHKTRVIPSCEYDSAHVPTLSIRHKLIFLQKNKLRFLSKLHFFKNVAFSRFLYQVEIIENLATDQNWVGLGCFQVWKVWIRPDLFLVLRLARERPRSEY